MSTAILRREVIEFRRDKRFLAVAAISVGLLLIAALDGWNRVDTEVRARAAAVEVDHEIWVNQGENNPHGAAHFARYAFREAPRLAAFDPGVFDFAGAAFWMEAHTQNPTTLRRAEDAAVRAPFATISPAWVVQVMGTLAIATVLFSAVAGERERGTLRALAAAGVSAQRFALGKLGAILGLVAVLTITAFLVAIVPSLASGTVSEISIPRLILMLSVYLMGLLAFAFVILTISAQARSSSAAFNAAALTWLFVALLCPVFAGQVATTLFPDVDEQHLKNDIQLRAQSPFWVGDAQEPAVAKMEQQVLAEFGAESFESLGFDREALILQAHEEFANEIYDELYGALSQRHTDQDTVLRIATLFSPVLAMQRLSSALAGTDLLAQQTFSEQAEQHRRRIIAQLNRNMMMNAGDQGFEYKADRSLWEAIPDFAPVPPSISDVLRRYVPEFFVLALWLLLGGILALRATRAAIGRGA
ncbi:MAG: DUF3526 domain-containing protein [Congregibacter sp.]